VNWAGLAVRARGLSTRLMPPAGLDELGAVQTAGELGALLQRHGYALPAHGVPELAAIERAVRRRTSDELSILTRWSIDSADALCVVIEDEDQRSLRGIVRGLAAGAPPAARISGAIATWQLPERLLEELAAESHIRGVAALLERAGHPFAPAVASAVDGAPIDLFGIEHALVRQFADRARDAATAHGGALATHVSQLIDALNAASALLIASRGGAIDPSSCYLEGGKLLDAAAFATIAAPRTTGARVVLAELFAETPLGELFSGRIPQPLEDAALQWHIATQAALRRTEPTGPAPLLWLVLRRRQESRRVRRVAWRLALGGGQ